MNGKIRLGIIATSLCLTVALIWSGAGMAMLFVRWIGAHPDMAKALPLLPLVLLPVVALVLFRRRRQAAISV
ncbi:hypothetical protein [Sphingomonas montana]|uniref:hypothetical protein n=1 Tax=Sphingomonas montana TaxID=1843236 RepID=UPI00096BF925|nr:hypothetical protein [Sphingomonas montana]